MAESIYLEVEENENCDYMPMLLYEAHRKPQKASKSNARQSPRDLFPGVDYHNSVNRQTLPLTPGH